MPFLIQITDPFRPQVGQVREHVACSRLSSQLRSRGLISGRGQRLRRTSRFMVSVNGDWKLQGDWHRRLRTDDVVLIVPLPMGGGGGSNPLRLALQVAIIAAAYYYPPMLLGQGLYASLATTAILIGGNVLLNAVLPLKTTNAQLASTQQAQNSYTLQGKGNQAKLMGAIPVWYGRRCHFPDYAAQTYTENLGNFQYLYSLYCLTQGEVEIEQIRIGDTPLSSFSEVTYEVIQPGGSVSLFPDNVVTSSDVSSGIELLGSNEDGYPASGWYGPYVANPAQSRANYLAIDITLPRGLVRINDKGGYDARSAQWEVQAREIDDNGDPIGATWDDDVGDWDDGGFVTLDSPMVTFATIDPQLMTFRYPVAQSRYQVRARRVDEKRTDSREANTVQWTGLRAYLPSARTFGNVTMLAMIIKATNNVNSSNFQQVNVIGTRKLPVWDGTAWSDPQPTRSPAWAFADALRNTDYGRGYPDKRINLAELLRLDGVWADRGDNFDYVFTDQTTLWEGMTTVARVGRAVPINYGGVIECIRNESKTVSDYQFSPYNMKRGSFSVTYPQVTSETPDYVVIEYVDPETWEAAEVECALEGSEKKKEKRVRIDGITDHDHAWREGISMAAANRDQRRLPSFSTRREIHLLRYGSLIDVSHDMPGWGQSGVVLGYDADLVLVSTDNDLEWTEGAQHYMALRDRKGRPMGPYPVSEAPGGAQLIGLSNEEKTTLNQEVQLAMSGTRVPMQYQFGPSVDQMALKCLVLTATPDDGDESGKVTCVNYAESVHTAEIDGNPPAPTPPNTIPVNPVAPVVDRVTVTRSATPGVYVIEASSAAGATSYEFEASLDGLIWQQLGSSTSPSITYQLAPGVWQVRACGIGILQGPWATWTGVLTDWSLIPETPTLALREPYTNRNVRVEVTGSGTWRFVEIYAIAAALENLIASYETSSASLNWSYDDAVEYGAVCPTYVVRVSDANAAGQSDWAELTATNPPPPAPVPTATATPGEESISVSIVIPAVAAPDFLEFRILITGETEPLASGAAGTYLVDVPLDTESITVQALDIWGNVSAVVLAIEEEEV